MAELGVHGATPFLLYVGKAGGPGGLRARLRRHAQTPWFEVADLLAARGRALPLWWGYADKVRQRRVPPMPPLAQVAFDQTLAWQHERIVWGWRDVPASVLSRHETALIAANVSLLNRRGRGYLRHGPPQLRAIGPYGEQRARWLFHTAWIAVLDRQPDGWARRGLRGTRVASDKHGWPAPLGEGQERLLKVPGERAARRIVGRCAPSELRAAASTPSEANEARAWWAAYAGHEFLPNPQGVEEALNTALRKRAVIPSALADLPDDASRARLVKLVATLPGIAH